MALIAQSVLLGIADRAAAQYKLIADAYDALNVVGTGWYFDRVTDTDDPDVEIPLDKPYKDMDDNFTVDKSLGRIGMDRLGVILGSMDAHFGREDSNGDPLQVGSWDGYCQTHDIRVSDYFNLLHYSAYSQRYMYANNVFSEGDDTLGTCEVAAGPVLQFADGINYGNGSDSNLATGGNFAATQLKIMVTTIGASDLALRLYVKDVNDILVTIDVTVPGSTPSGTSIDVGTSSDRFLDVTNVIYVPFGTTGNLGDIVTIRNKKEREIAL